MKVVLALLYSVIVFVLISCASQVESTETPIDAAGSEEVHQIEKPPYMAILEEYNLSTAAPFSLPAPGYIGLFTVGNDNCDYKSLSEALASDKVKEGFLLQLTEAEYTESELEVSKSIIIKGMTDATTVIRAKEPEDKARGRIFTVVPGAHLTLMNIHLENGQPIDSLRTGGAICNYGRLTLYHCVLSDNTANCGGAIHNEKGTLIALGCKFYGNYADGKNKDGRDCGSGGAVKTQDDGTAILIDCVLEDNRAKYKGGAVKTSCLSRTVIVDCRIADNRCVATGGGIDSGGPLHIVHTTITGNEARGRKRYSSFAGLKAGSGIYAKGDLFLYDSVVTDEDSHYDVVVEPGSIFVNSNNLIGNSEYDSTHNR